MRTGLFFLPSIPLNLLHFPCQNPVTANEIERYGFPAGTGTMQLVSYWNSELKATPVRQDQYRQLIAGSVFPLCPAPGSKTG